MTVIKNFALLGLMLIVLGACDQKVKTKDNSSNDSEDQTTETQKQYPAAAKMKEIDQIQNELQQVESLRWENTESEQSSFKEVRAYLNDDQQPLKIVEHFANGGHNGQGQRHYYFENGKVIAFYEKKDDWVDTTQSVYVETQTFYNDEEPVATRTRSAEYADEIEKSSWKEMRPTHHSLQTVNNILEGKGRFETHFISVIKGGNQLFLLLGEPKEENRYITTVRVDEKTPFISDLVQNLEEYKFRPVEIQFKVVGGGGKPEFRVLTNAQWKDE
ncbi:MAG: hypothetical protein ACQERC_08870 [Bacteroidota bacterium]